MAITTYAELSTAVANWLQRTDLTSRVPEFIALAESKIRRKLAVREQETKTASISINAEYVAVPADFSGVSYFELGVSPRQMLDFETMETQTKLYTTPGQPKTYCIIGDNFRFAPTPNTAYSSTLIYFADLPSLGSLTTTNWLISKHPDLYLCASLLQAEFFLRDDPRLPILKADYDETIRSITANSNAAKWSGPAMASHAERVA